MSPFAIQLINGCIESDIEEEDRDNFLNLKKINIIEKIDNLWRLKSLYRVGELYIKKDGIGFVEAQHKEHKDLLIEADNLGDASSGDVVLVKRIIARRGRASAKVISIITKAHPYEILYTYKNKNGNFEIRNIRNSLPSNAKMKDMDIKAFKIGTVMKVDSSTDEVLEIFGHLGDPKVDEKISLALYKREDLFPIDCISQAEAVPLEVKIDDYSNRVNLTHLDFCTIDPLTAKDFDDAIYFDHKNYILYVAIADVSHYVDYFSPIDKEAKKRGFTTYLPHKSFPMLPRELSENLCSLKPNVNRLSFICKITIDNNNLKVIKEEFFEAIIHSKRRFNYEQIDRYINNNGEGAEDIDIEILKYLFPLYKVTQEIKGNRLKNGFNFRSDEVRLSIDSEHILTNTTIESSTPSHSLIEECMLLANQASAKIFNEKELSIFRIHEPPQLNKIETLLEELSTIGIFVKQYKDSPSLIRAIQEQASMINLESEVDSMIIKSLRRASYSPFNSGHFGLGFTHYSHFTSPIRRYSDLILHRLIKAKLNQDEEQNSYLLRNIEPLCVRVSDLERESTKAEWDFKDRKFARWAEKNIGLSFDAEVIEAGENSKAIIYGDISGIVINILDKNVTLFDKIKIKIKYVDMALAKIMGEVILNKR